MKRNLNPRAKPATVDEYLASLSSEKRAMLQKLRKDIRAAAPEPEECISYGIPGVRLKGAYLLGFGATEKHCSFYAGSIIQRYRSELKNYSLAKGTIRFAADNPLPAALVRKLVKARLRSEKPALVAPGGDTY